MDRYVKAVLTVIAGCLLVLVGNQIDFPQKAHAVSSSSSEGTMMVVPRLRMMGWCTS